MLGLLKNIWLGLALITLASALLLVSDLDRRQAAVPPVENKKLPRLAVMQWVSTDLLDRTVAGILAGLKQQGFEDGKTARIRFYNAAGDIATANMMAKEMTSGGFDLVLTASTMALQSVAAANRDRRVLHVFGAVTDPYNAGVGITGPAPDQHPPYMAGVGTFQPVEAAFRIARQLNPGLQRVGVVWNPSEDNSEACVRKARIACNELGIELVEANCSNSSEVPEGVRSVLGRNVQAIWVGGDTVANAAIHSIIAVAKEAGLPVFSNDPNDAARGALFGLGASYQQVGVAVGDMGGQILRGASPSSFGVANLVPEVLALNEPLASTLQGWTVSDELRKRAADSARKAGSVARAPEPGRTYRVGVVCFGPNPVFEMATAGVKEGLAEAGFVEGDNLILQSVHANNDVGILRQAVQQLENSKPDLLIPLSTPCLAGVLAGTKNIPVVFGVVSAPLESGAGESFEQHLPHVTGAVWSAPSPEAFVWMNRLFPNLRKLGVVYNPAHSSSQVEVAAIREQCTKYGWTLVERTLSTSSEIVEAMASLLQAEPDAVFAIGENTVVSAFSSVADACRKAKVPLIADDNSLMGSGALFSIGGSPQLEGRHTGQLAARVLLGEDPADIPFAPSVETETAVDVAAAKPLGVEFPVEFLKETDIFHHMGQLKERTLRVAMINLVQSRVLDLGEAGFVRGLREAGLVEGTDYTLHRYNAQGEISQLPTILDAAKNISPDILLTLTTPAMLAAAKREQEIPIVFTIASDPIALGTFTRQTVPGNLTGVHDDPPVDRLLDMAVERHPGLAKVGIVYDPSQPNAVLSVVKLRGACAKKNVKLVEATASALSELSVAVQSLIQQGVGALLLSADNLVCTGFSVIQKNMSAAGIPIYVTDINLMEEGATGAIGEDYGAWAAQSGRMAAKVLAGVPCREIPLQTAEVQLVLAPKAKVSAPPVVEPKRPVEIRIVRYNDAVFSEDTTRGILDGFHAAGWQEGREFNMRILNAQGDMSTLNSILTAVVGEHPDLIMPISTPSLQAALRQASAFPIVFASVGDGVRSGAGASVSNHLPNVTGITTKSPFEGMVRLIRATLPGARKIGTLFVPAEDNSELYRRWFAEALEAEGLQLVAVPVATSAEVSEGTTALLRSDIQLIAQISDNATRPGYGQIIKRANEAKIPFFCFDTSGVREGATLALACDFYDTGLEAARVAIRVLQGASPADIPFANTPTENLMVNPKLMQGFGLVLPEEFKARMVEYHED